MLRRLVSACVAVVLTALPAALVSAQERGLLWEVRGERGTIWLLGSMHFASDALYPLPPAVDAAFESADVVGFEIDLDEAAGSAWTMLDKGTLRDGTLDQRISAETWEEVKSRLEKRGLGTAGFDRMQPWFLAMNLTITELQTAGFDPQKGLDQHLFSRAKGAGKRRIALETVEFQLALFDGLEGEQADDFLRHTLRELDEVVPLIEGITNDWKAGDLAALERLLLEGFEEFPELFNALVRDRNQRWHQQVCELLAANDDVLLVVGALHLVGEQGLVASLQRQGYVVERR